MTSTATGAGAIRLPLPFAPRQFRALVPRAAPLLRRITVADDGAVWVTLADPPPSSPEGTRFDIFEPGGRLVGELELDFPFTLHQVRGGRIYGVARDALGVERVYGARVDGTPHPS